MDIRIPIGLALWAALSTPGPVWAQDGCPDIAGLEWMAGTWSGGDSGVATVESWLEPAGGIMVGVHRDVFAPDRVFFEFLRIAPDETGALTYFASPRGRAATPFRLVECAAGRAVFENPDHDYPQRIVYERRGDELIAAIEGVEGGVSKRSEWRWTRTAPR